tara:strand:- start:386 stop:1156 length:771 start_codon:yes stop_codon:yes gene_type:complete
MKIGVIGVGVVGTAIEQGFRDLGHIVKTHDIKFNTRIENVLDTKIVFLCLPTNPDRRGECNTKPIFQVVRRLNHLKYKGIIAIKSTIIPGTYAELKKEFDEERMCHVPEFLREKFAYEDFTENHNVLVVGAPNYDVSRIVINCHGNYPKNVIEMKPEEAEFVKYFSNVFKAVKITFANSFGKICDEFDIDYNSVLKAFELENVKETSYLKYSDELRGFGGMCLPKDVQALSKLVENKDIDVNLFKFILDENEKFIR